MTTFRRWPLFDLLVVKYWDEHLGWTEASKWSAKDLVSLELFANGELQRRASTSNSRGEVIHVEGTQTRH